MLLVGYVEKKIQKRKGPVPAFQHFLDGLIHFFAFCAAESDVRYRGLKLSVTTILLCSPYSSNNFLNRNMQSSIMAQECCRNSAPPHYRMFLNRKVR